MDGKMADRRQKGQSVIELITTYSWALLIVSLFVAVAFVLSGNPGGQNYLASSCNIQPSLPCSDAELSAYNSVSNPQYYISFLNQLQVPLFFGSNAFNATTTGLGIVGVSHYYGQCNPTFALPGDKITCQAKITGPVFPPIGTKTNVYFILNYQICGSNMESSCGGATYKSSGFSTQSVSPSAARLFTLYYTANGIDSSGSLTDTNALLVVNGAPYTTGQNVVIPNTGNFAIYLQSPAGFAIVSWTANAGATISPSAANTINATLVMTGDANIIATYTNWACYNCKILPNGQCPGVCPTSVSCGLSRNKCTH